MYWEKEHLCLINLSETGPKSMRAYGSLGWDFVWIGSGSVIFINRNKGRVGQ
jgi:hypothetical protein